MVLIRQGKKKVQLPMIRKVTLKQESRPLWVQGIDLAAELEDDEEEEYLQVNPTIIPVFDIDVLAILASQSGLDQETLQHAESTSSIKE